MSWPKDGPYLYPLTPKAVDGPCLVTAVFLAFSYMVIPIQAIAAAARVRRIAS